MYCIWNTILLAILFARNIVVGLIVLLCFVLFLTFPLHVIEQVQFFKNKFVNVFKSPDSFSNEYHIKIQHYYKRLLCESSEQSVLWLGVYPRSKMGRANNHKPQYTIEY